jgi:hypothetical protein
MFNRDITKPWTLEVRVLFLYLFIFVCTRDSIGMRLTNAGRRKGSPPGWSLRGQEMDHDSHGAA